MLPTPLKQTKTIVVSWTHKFSYFAIFPIASLCTTGVTVALSRVALHREKHISSSCFGCWFVNIELMANSTCAWTKVLPHPSGAKECWTTFQLCWRDRTGWGKGGGVNKKHKNAKIRPLIRTQKGLSNFSENVWKKYESLNEKTEPCLFLPQPGRCIWDDWAFLPLCICWRVVI